MKMRINFLIIFLIVFLYSCQSDYTKLVKSEMAKNIDTDSIFYGMKFGQTKDQFYELCWEYNRKKILTHGPSNNYVQAILYPQDSTKIADKIQMLFYGRFNEDKIMTAMDIKFSYVAWAPWNTNLYADKLIPRVKDTLMKWYPGNTFFSIDDMQVKVDGNRQIRLKKESDQNVSVVIEDLEYKVNKLK